MAADEFVVVADQICDAMAFAHSNRIVHGNLRPQNILFDDTNTVKVMDFGFEPHYEETIEENWYKPPGESASPQADVFAAGVIFYQLLTGSLPEWKRGLLQPCEAFSEIPQNLRTVIKGMLCLETHVRVQTFEEVKHALHLVEEKGSKKDKTKIKTAPKKSKQRGPMRTLVLTAALVLLLGVNGALYFWIYVKKSGENSVTTVLQNNKPNEEQEFQFQKVDKTKPN